MDINSFEDLKGSTLSSISKTDDEIVFTLQNGEKYRLCHRQDCCEDVYIEDIDGNLQDLVGTPLLLAEEVSNCNEPPPTDRDPESYTWTFYKMASANGYVTIRWFGQSNGYYSERVDFERLD